MSGAERCSRCGDDLEDDRHGETLCEDCESELDHRARVEGVHCPSCDGRGDFIDCFDDLCHANGECFHTGNTVCKLCGGDGRVTPKGREQYYDERLAERAQVGPLETVALFVVLVIVFYAALAIVSGVILT